MVNTMLTCLFQPIGYSPPSREFRASTQGRNLKAGSKAEIMRNAAYCLDLSNSVPSLFIRQSEDISPSLILDPSSLPWVFDIVLWCLMLKYLFTRMLLIWSSWICLFQEETLHKSTSSSSASPSLYEDPVLEAMCSRKSECTLHKIRDLERGPHSALIIWNR